MQCNHALAAVMSVMPVMAKEPWSGRLEPSNVFTQSSSETNTNEYGKFSSCVLARPSWERSPTSGGQSKTRRLGYPRGDRRQADVNGQTSYFPAGNIAINLPNLHCDPVCRPWFRLSEQAYRPIRVGTCWRSSRKAHGTSS